MFPLPALDATPQAGMVALLLVIMLNVLGFDITTSSFHHSNGSSDTSTDLVPVPTTAAIIRTSDNIYVNGISIGMNITDIRTQNKNFPTEGTNTAQEDGWIRTVAEYQDASYYFDGEGILHRIGIKNTPENINASSTLAQAQKVYGSPIINFCSLNDADESDLINPESHCRGDSYAVFTALTTQNLAWLIEYEYSSTLNYPIKKIFLTDGLKRYQSNTSTTQSA